MKIITLTLILGLPLMVLGQQPDEQKAQGQQAETKATAPPKASKGQPAQEQAKPQTKSETPASVREKADVKANAPAGSTNKDAAAGASKTETQTRASGSTTTVNKTEFRSRHAEVFSLGRHPKDFFVERYGASHFRLFGNTYFVFVDNCWVAVDVDGFTYTERMICEGDPDYVVVD